MGLSETVAQVLSDQGQLSQRLPGFRPRAGQTEMAIAAAEVMEQGGILVVEAGTGIGKTFAYLVPALLSGQRILVSTATKTLQDQLFKRDLPALVQALGLPLKTAMLKGRASYLCRYRLAQAREASIVLGRDWGTAIASVELWAQQTPTGDLAELPGLDERSSLIPHITSTRDNCLGSACPSFQQCHVVQARRSALAADLVVVNHHLFFADLIVRETGMAELLPSVSTVIFDEAHQLNETGVQFMGLQLSTAQLTDLGRDLQAQGVLRARGWRDWSALAGDLAQTVRALRDLLPQVRTSTRLNWRTLIPDGLDSTPWQQALADIQAALGSIGDSVAAVSESSPDWGRLEQRTLELQARLENFQHVCGSDVVRWLELGDTVRLVESPLYIANAVRARLVAPLQPTSGNRSMLFTSATLGAEASLQSFLEPCGLEGAKVFRIESPFDYSKQAALFVPRDIPSPGDAGHSQAVAVLAAQLAAEVGGRTLVLTTSLRALSCIGEVLQHHFAQSRQIEVLIQGQQSKQSLIERFRLGQTGGRAGCVLVASVSFWEGVDIPGDPLQLVVIDKLPFPSPADPLVQAHAGRMLDEGKNVFKDYYLPQTALALKQGAGRLIRSETDRGLLVICDKRLAHKSYGRQLMAALPPMRRVQTQDELMQVVSWLTKPSTKDPSLS